MKYSSLILGNSSSAIIEGPSFNIPILNIGERQAGREFSRQIFSCKLDVKSINKTLNKILKKNKRKQFNNIYYKKSNEIRTFKVN